MAARPIVCFGVDVRGWALENNAWQLSRRLADDFDARPVTCDDDPADCDVLVAMWWAGLSEFRRRFRPRKVLLGFNGLDSWINVPEPTLRGLVATVDGVYAISQEGQGALQNTLQQPVWLCPDGVDLDMFPLLPLPSTFTAGWTGNASRGKDFKGVKILREACEMAGVPLVERDLPPAPRLAHEHVRSFYRQISLYVCASESEGTPLPVLEALACGRPVVSTCVGIVPELPWYGGAGVHIVNRAAHPIAGAIRVARGRAHPEKLCEMSREIAAQRSWAVTADAWRTMIRSVL